MIYLGRTYIIQKRPEQAVALNREMLATSPAFPLAHWLLGLSLVEARQLEEAKREIRTALALGYRFQTEKEPEVLRGIFGERGFNELVRPR
jgi:Flp pilus assembly protein TadD